MLTCQKVSNDKPRMVIIMLNITMRVTPALLTVYPIIEVCLFALIVASKEI